VCIHQEPIPAWTNEMGHFAAFFDNLCAAYGRADLFQVVTSDAGVLNEAHCRKLDELGYGYVVALKDNNPLLELEARGLLQSLAEHEPCTAQDDGWECDSSRGWVKRELWTSTEIAHWPGWEHLRQVWLVRVWRRKTKDGPIEHLEDRVYATNLPTAHRIRGQQILTLVRAHWRIENELHGTLDIQLREDDPWWVRRGYGLINTGLLRAIAYNRSGRSPALLDGVRGGRRSPAPLDGVNVLAIARAVHLRRQQLISWQQLRDWLRDALVWWGLLDSTQPQPEASAAPD
jgi:hypothetical protein